MKIYLPANAIIIPITRNGKKYHFFLDSGFPFSFSNDLKVINSINNLDIQVDQQFRLPLSQAPIDITPLSQHLMINLTGFLGMDFISLFDNLKINFKTRELDFNAGDFKSDLDRNALSISIGISGRFAPEQVADLPRNLQDNRRSALILASWKGHTEVVQLLLANGSDVRATMEKDGSIISALHLASKEGHTDIVQLLIDSGADVNFEDTDIWTALHFASKEGHTDIVRLLLDKGADVDAATNSYTRNIDDKDGWTALQHASSEGYTDIVQLLLDRGADVNIKDSTGWTALHLASCEGHTNIVQLLIDSRADINVEDTDGRTALHLASFKDHDDIVQLLIDKESEIVHLA